MYRKSKNSLIAAIAVLTILTFVAFAITMSTTRNNDSNRNNVQNNENQIYNQDERGSQEQNRIPKMNAIKVSEDTKEYMFPTHDPLKDVDQENEPSFERPFIPNLKKATKRPTPTSAMVTEYDPFNLEKEKEQQSKEQKNEPKQENESLTYLILFNVNGTKALEYNIAGEFTLENTKFYVVGHSPKSIQRINGFINRKYYIYKKNKDTIVQCFELFERQERAEKGVTDLIRVKTDSYDTEVTFNGANNVTRRVNNNHLLSPYSDKKDRILIIKNLTPTEQNEKN